MSQSKMSDLVDMLPGDLVSDLLDFAVGQELRVAICNYQHGSSVKPVMVDYYSSNDQSPEQTPRPWLMQREIEAGVADHAVARFWEINASRYVEEKFGNLAHDDRLSLARLISSFMMSRYRETIIQLKSTGGYHSWDTFWARTIKELEIGE